MSQPEGCQENITAYRKAIVIENKGLFLCLGLLLLSMSIVCGAIILNDTEKWRIIFPVIFFCFFANRIMTQISLNYLELIPIEKPRNPFEMNLAKPQKPL